MTDFSQSMNTVHSPLDSTEADVEYVGVNFRQFRSTSNRWGI